MSDTPQGTDWWMASDGKWYPPQAATSPSPAAPPPPTVPPVVQPLYVQQPAVSARGPINDGFCITGLVCGIVALVVCYPGIILGVLGLVFGILGIKRVDRSGGTRTGRGMGLAGAICGGIAVALWVTLFVVAILASNNSGSDYYY